MNQHVMKKCFLQVLNKNGAAARIKTVQFSVVYFIRFRAVAVFYSKSIPTY